MQETPRAATGPAARGDADECRGATGLLGFYHPAPFPAKSPRISLGLLFPTSKFICWEIRGRRRRRTGSTSKMNSHFCLDEHLQNCFNEVSPGSRAAQCSSTATRALVVGTLTPSHWPEGLVPASCTQTRAAPQRHTEMGFGGGTPNVLNSRERNFLEGQSNASSRKGVGLQGHREQE